jgi:hypothetical protein
VDKYLKTIGAGWLYIVLVSIGVMADQTNKTIRKNY